MLGKFKEGLLCYFSTAENILCSPPLFSLFVIRLSHCELYLLGVSRHYQNAAGNIMIVMKFSCRKSDLNYAIVSSPCANTLCIICCRLSIQCSSCLNFIKAFSTLLHLCHLRASLLSACGDVILIALGCLK